MGTTNLNRLALDAGGLDLGGTTVTASAAELNRLDASASDGCDLAYQDTQLTAAQVKALAATNVTLVTAPGAGLAAIPVAWYGYLEHGGTNDFVQTAGTDQLALRYAASTEIAEIGSEAQVTALIEASADAPLYDTIEGGFVPEANKAIVLDNNGANEYTGNAANDNTLSIRVWYRVVPMASFT